MHPYNSKLEFIPSRYIVREQCIKPHCAVTNVDRQKKLSYKTPPSVRCKPGDYFRHYGPHGFGSSVLERYIHFDRFLGLEDIHVQELEDMLTTFVYVNAGVGWAREYELSLGSHQIHQKLAAPAKEKLYPGDCLKVWLLDQPREKDSALTVDFALLEGKNNVQLKLYCPGRVYFNYINDIIGWRLVHFIGYGPMLMRSGPVYEVVSR